MVDILYSCSVATCQYELTQFRDLPIPGLKVCRKGVGQGYPESFPKSTYSITEATLATIMLHNQITAMMIIFNQ